MYAIAAVAPAAIATAHSVEPTAPALNGPAVVLWAS